MVNLTQGEGLQDAVEPGCPFLQGSIDQMLEREWLITNGQGGYASGTVAGCATRRYHGLLVWSRMPPLQRYVMLSGALERLITPTGQTIDLSTFEFNGAIFPQGYRDLIAFDYETAPPQPWVRFTWQVGDVKIVKTVRLVYQEPHCTVTYEIFPQEPGIHQFQVKPMLAMRDFHHLRRKPSGSPFALQMLPGGVHVRHVQEPGVTLCLAATGPMAQQTQFTEAQDWWYNFLYRQEAARQMECGEDLYAPGWFSATGEGPLVLQLTVVPGTEDIIDGMRRAWRAPQEVPAESWRISGPQPVKRLSRAAQQFLVERRTTRGACLLTILAGYHWFGDWGRDTAIALPGILLSTGRCEEAKDVLTTFAQMQQRGLIPNRFDDRGAGCDYNSVDASLWFVRAVEQLAEVTQDHTLWQGKLGRAVRNVVESFVAGTDFDIQADEDGLLRCGNADTQLTWMDAKFDNRAITPRYGKPVEINALWIHALRTAARYEAGTAGEQAATWGALAERASARFAEVFWYEEGGYMYDVIRDDFKDASLRPNQAIALALPTCPLSESQQQRALAAVEKKLLTPYGLRTLSQDHPEYKAQCAGDWKSRDEAYHQGTVWPWLIGPFIEAYLRIHGNSHAAKTQAREWLVPLMEHLECDGCLGSINEIFDGDAPHAPRGAVAQAWSVSEVLRAMLLAQDPSQQQSNGHHTRRVNVGIAAMGG